MPQNIFGSNPNRRTIVTIQKPEATEAPKPDLYQNTTDIDSLMNVGLRNISGMMNTISESVRLGVFDRETVQNLKDLLHMLGDLKKREQDLLATLKDEDLEKLTK